MTFMHTPTASIKRRRAGFARGRIGAALVAA